MATAAATGHHNNHAEFVDISHPVPLHYHEDDEYEDDKEHHEQSDLRGDRSNIAILFFLYLLQGIPLGLTAAIPMLLQNRGASYKQQVSDCSIFPVINIAICINYFVIAFNWIHTTSN